MNTTRLLKQGIEILLIIVEFFLGLRFLLKLFGANPTADFVAWIYATSAPLLEPFRGMFPSPTLEEGFILEFSTLFALVVYSLAAWLLVELIKLVETAGEKRRTHGRQQGN